MEFLVGFIIELFALFFLSRLVSSYLSLAFYRITKSKKITIYLIALLFFPGTLIHELAHALVAAILFVRIGAIDLLPKLEGEIVKLGSVEIARPDFVRRFFIGIAPFVVGTSLLIFLLYFFTTQHLFSQPLFLIIAIYATFEIGNTMFASEKDMEGALEFIIAALVIGFLVFFVGLHSAIDWQKIVSNPTVVQIFSQGALLLLIPLGIDALLVLVFRFLIKR